MVAIATVLLLYKTHIKLLNPHFSLEFKGTLHSSRGKGVGHARPRAVERDDQSVTGCRRSAQRPLFQNKQPQAPCGGILPKAVRKLRKRYNY
jgi:hypothetical protein